MGKKLTYQRKPWLKTKHQYKMDEVRRARKLKLLEEDFRNYKKTQKNVE